ncbi:hypothetical protein ACFS5N_10200 [Mucilaginibacter ximonensis]|uniref:Uncharacterized protein n=1 Tax=Mucilaginibacter ximonensis TaxID=538021 RepID=A0ABW5YCZ2_9SPHI
MMKRFSAMFTVKVYLITALAFALHLHFCGKVFAGVTVNGPTKTCSVPMASKKCCKEKQVDVKIKDSHQTESPSLMKKLFGFEISKIPFGDYVLSAQQALLDKLNATPPPPSPSSGKEAQYIKNCSLHI